MNFKLLIMKKITLTILAVISLTSYLFAGGMQHNTNQSTQWIRTMCRDASTEIDAVYYNPAGLTKLDDGFHIAFNNQSIFQTRFITSNNSLLQPSPKEYEGETPVPFLPTLLMAYKADKLVFSGGMVMIGGGGSADFKAGIPSIEADIAALPTMLSANEITTTQYSADMKFKQSAAYIGIQAGISYEINEMLSVYLGGRYVMAPKGLNTITGSIESIMINPDYPSLGYDGTMVSANQFFTDAANANYALAGGVPQYVAGLGNIIAGGGGSVPLSSGTNVGLSATDVATIEKMITDAGQNPENMDIQTAQYILSQAEPLLVAGYNQAGDDLSANATATADAEVDVEQTGSGITPIFGANLTFGDLNIGLKYEHYTRITMTNSTKIDQTGMFPDKAEKRSDLPAMFSIGAHYLMNNKLGVSVGYHQYFDRMSNYGYAPGEDNEEYLDKNAMEFAIGLEYILSDKLLLSAGYLYANTGLKDMYQNDMTNSLPSQTFGFGGQFNINESLDLNMGFLYTVYTDKEGSFTNAAAQSYTETYARDNIGFAIGIGYRITNNNE